MPEEALAFIVRDLAQRDLWPHVVVVLLAYDTFAREADWESVIANDVAVHEAGATGQLVVAMVLGAFLVLAVRQDRCGSGGRGGGRPRCGHRG